MKQFFLNYKAQAFAAITLALLQVSFLSGSFKSADRYVATELGESHTTGGVTILEVSDETEGAKPSDISDKPLSEGKITEEQLDAIKNAHANYKEKAEECLVKLSSIKDVEEAEENFDDNKTSANLLALANVLKDLGFLKTNVSNAKKDGDLSGLSFGSKKRSKSSSSHVLDPDDKDDLEDIVACHEYRLKNLDSAADKKAYFKKHIEEKFVDQLAKSDSKEIAALAEEFKKAAQKSDPQNLLGFTLIANLHSEYAMLMAQAANVRALQTRVAQNPNDAAAQSQLQLAKTNLDIQFKSIRSRYNAQVVSAAGNDPQAALTLQNEIQNKTLYWSQQLNNVVNGQATTSFANSPAGTIAGVTQPINLFGTNSVSLDPNNTYLNGTGNTVIGGSNLMLADPSNVRIYRQNTIGAVQLQGLTGTQKYTMPTLGSSVTRGPFN